MMEDDISYGISTAFEALWKKHMVPGAKYPTVVNLPELLLLQFYDRIHEGKPTLCTLKHAQKFLVPSLVKNSTELCIEFPKNTIFVCQGFMNGKEKRTGLDWLEKVYVTIMPHFDVDKIPFSMSFSVPIGNLDIIGDPRD